ncbi:hypothetical protein [Saccharothrix obliqua]|nr:hypothetical protein [Saccharothrix obliqua]MBW4719463.1 hypothetical protein [Saccharothrix obliqua]
MPHRGTAVNRAAALAARHKQHGKIVPYDNPSSSMHLFLTAIGAAR